MEHCSKSGGNAGSQIAPPDAVPMQAAHRVTSQSAVSGRVLMNFGQLQAKLNVSERTARKIIAEPWMCDPVELGPRALRWVESEVDEALALRAPRRPEPHSEPVQLLRGKVERLKRMGKLTQAEA
jgi:predicted DNA-binding transcriptional regulator AlpA